jgi:hypothetical protein
MICQKCTGSASSTVGIGVCIIFAGVGFVAFYSSFARKYFNENVTSSTPFASLKHSMKAFHDKVETKFEVAQQVLKIVVSYFQIVGGLAFAFDLRFPPVYSTVMDFLSGVVNVNFLSLMPLGCVFPSNYHTQLLGYTLTPLFVSCIVFIVYKLSERCSRVSEKVIAMKNRLFSSFLLLTFMLLPTVSVKIFSTFACRTFDGDYGSFLKVDLSINCDSRQHAFYVAYAVLMTFVYPIGIPFLYFVLLRRELPLISPDDEVLRDSVSEKKAKELALSKRAQIEVAHPHVKRLSFLYSAYSPKYWWFEVFETLRKLLLTGGLVFVSPGSAGQIVISILICIFSMHFYAENKPFVNPFVYFIFQIGQWQLFVTMLAALAIRVSIDGESLEDRNAFDVLLVILQFVAPIVIIVLNVVARLGNLMFVQRLLTKKVQPILAVCKDEDKGNKSEAAA